METNTFNNAVVNAVKEMTGCQFVHLIYLSEPSLNKTQKAAIAGTVEVTPIQKIVDTIVQVGFSYENAVNNRGEKEQGAPINFVAESLPWGKWVDGQENKLIEHKGEIYLRFYGVKDAHTTCEYFVGGEPATAEQIALIKEYTERKPTKTQTNAGLTENQVIARCVKINNVIAATINGTEYKRRKKPAHQAA